jgi:ABC-type amino acid transport substrate-binding protein
MNKLLLTALLLASFIIPTSVSATEEYPPCSKVCDEAEYDKYIVKDKFFIMRDRIPNPNEETTNEETTNVPLKRSDVLNKSDGCSGKQQDHWRCVSNTIDNKGYVHCCGLKKYRELTFWVQDFQPYTSCEGEEDEMKATGKGIEIMKEICKYAVVHCNFKCTKKWGEDTKDLNGGWGMSFSLSDSTREKSNYISNPPLLKFKYAFFALKDTEHAKPWKSGINEVKEAIESLKGKIGVYDGGTRMYLEGEKIMQGEDKLKDKTEIVKTSDKVLNLLKEKTVDVIFSNTQVAAYYARINKMDICRVSEEYDDNYHIMISRKEKDNNGDPFDGNSLIEDINKAIKENSEALRSLSQQEKPDPCK